MPKMPRAHVRKQSIETRAEELALQCRPLVEAFVYALSQYDEQVSRLKEYTSPEPIDIIQNIQYNLSRTMIYRNNYELFHLFLLGLVVSQQELEFPPAVLRETYNIPKHDYKPSKMLYEIFKDRQDAVHYIESVTLGIVRNLSDKACNHIIVQVLQKKPHQVPAEIIESCINTEVEPLEFELFPEFTHATDPITNIRETLQKENQVKRKK